MMSPPRGHRVSLCGRGPRTLVSAKETSSNEGPQPHSRGSEKPTAPSARKTGRRERPHMSQALTQCQLLSSRLSFKKGLAGNSGEPLSGFFWGVTILSTTETCARSSHGTVSCSIIRLLAQGCCCRQVAAPGVVHTEVFWTAKMTRLLWTQPCHCPLCLLAHHSLQGERVWETGQVSSFSLNTAHEHCSLLPASVLTLSPACPSGLPNLMQHPALPMGRQATSRTIPQLHLPDAMLLALTGWKLLEAQGNVAGTHVRLRNTRAPPP